MKNIFQIVLFLVSLLSISYANKNSSYIELAKIDNHILTTEVLGKKAKIFPTLNKKEQKALANALINDEILTQYLLKDNNITKIKDKQERIKKAISKIKNMAIDELNVTISENKIKKFYNSNKKKFWHENFYIASHILVKDETKAKEIIKILENSKDFNKTFKTIATKESIDNKTNKQQGMIGAFPDRIMIKPFREALKKLNKNEFTHKPIKTRFGYHIIWLHDKFKEGYYPYRIAKKNIRAKMLKEKLIKWTNQKLQEAKKSVNVKIL
ncbi:MAG TPA: hypothetical protein ENK99_06540, partial [Campylobacterales bacterium]|nr:hypothetical protein [Campylobacterales bacterium]